MWWWGRKKINSSLLIISLNIRILQDCIAFVDIVLSEALLDWCHRHLFLYPLSISWCSNWYKHFSIRKLSGNNTRNSTINCDFQLTSFHQPPVSQLPCILKALLIHMVYFLDWERKLISHIYMVYLRLRGWIVASWWANWSHSFPSLTYCLRTMFPRGISSHMGQFLQGRNFCSFVSFLAVQDSPIGALVTHSLSQALILVDTSRH